MQIVVRCQFSQSFLSPAHRLIGLYTQAYIGLYTRSVEKTQLHLVESWLRIGVELHAQPVAEGKESLDDIYATSYIFVRGVVGCGSLCCC